MISIARILGAPVMVPAGNVARKTSRAVSPSFSSPSTWLTMWSTCEYFSTFMNSVTFTVPNFDTRPTSFRPRSTSITCSARSFSSASSSAERLSSSAGVAPRRLVPAIGRRVSLELDTRTSSSGELPTISIPSRTRWYM